MNVLITSAGRRVGLLRAFQDAAASLGGEVWIAEMDGLAPAGFVADGAVRVPHVREDAYAERLREAVEAHAIGLVVPTIDTELPRLAELAPELLACGCRVASSTPAFVAITSDKWSTYQTAVEADIPTIRSWLPGDDGIPDRLFVKPRAGSSSQHTYRASSDTLAEVLPRVPDPIVQELIEGEEITVDCLYTFDGELLHYVPRRRIRTVGGESIQGLTLREPDLNAWLERMLPRLGEMGARGPVTTQVFRTGDRLLLLEVNPRFGGGYPLSYAAGAAYPEWLIRLAQGEPVEPALGRYRDGLYMTRHYVETITEGPLWT